MRSFFLILFAMATSGLAGQTAGTLHVSSSAGLRIYVDGKFAGLSTAAQGGLLLPGLPAGEHQIKVTRSGYVPKTFVVVVGAATSVELEVGKLKVRPRVRAKPDEEPVDMTVASPPMALDDTGTPGEGNWEVNVLADGDLSRDSDEFEFPLLDINYGLNEKIQLKYEGNYKFTKSAEYDEAGNRRTTRARGPGDSTLGIKYRFYDNDETNLSLAIYPQVEFRSPGGRGPDDGGVAPSGTTWLLPLLLTKDFGHASVTADADVEKSTSDPKATLFAGIGIGTRVTDKIAVLADIGGHDLNRSGDRRIFIELGLRRKINESNAFVASIGLDAFAGRDAQRHRTVTVGYQRFIGTKE
jgi:hypothetical protein